MNDMNDMNEPDTATAVRDGSHAADSAPGNQQADIVNLIELRLDQFSGQERAVATVVIEDPAAAMESTIEQLAQAAGCSEATVTRFCKTIGLRGYPQLRLRLAAAATERRRASGQGFAMLSEIEPTDSTERIVSKLRNAETRALAVTFDNLDVAAVTRAVDILAASRRTMTFGVGSSATAAFDASVKLGLSGRPAMVAHDVHTALMTMATMQPGEVVMVFTHSGKPREVLDVLQFATQGGVDTIVVTSASASSAAHAATVALVTAAREPTTRSGGITSRLVQLAMVDVLFVLLAQRRHDEAASEATRMREAVADYVVGNEEQTA